MKQSSLALAIGSMVVGSAVPTAQAITFGNEFVSGELTTTLATGIGVRTESPDPDMLTVGNTGGPAGRASPGVWTYQGDLNYDKGDAFTRYLKGTHELKLDFPNDFSFTASGTWQQDWAANNTTGWLAGDAPAGLPNNGLSKEAEDQLTFNARLLDFYLTKRFDLGEQRASISVGNQVINWGETMFAMGGINTTSPMDLLRLSSPGTQLKEAMLATPMVSFTTGLGNGLSMEAYAGFGWEQHYFAPSGSYWGSDGLSDGHNTYGLEDYDADDSGEWGLSLRYDMNDHPVSLGAYVINYHEKAPQLSIDPYHDYSFAAGWVYPEDRHLIGVSANAAIGDWAVGTELSYRPNAPVTLNAVGGCAGNNFECWVDEDLWTFAINGMLNLSPANTPGLLNLLGADGGFFMVEYMAMYYPNLKRSYNGELVSPGLWAWGQEVGDDGVDRAAGSKLSSGISMDLSFNYDGTIIPGWMVTPEIYYSYAFNGRTPTFMAYYMEGAQSANLSVTVARSQSDWKFGLNYAAFWGGESKFDQPFSDRDYVGAYLSYDF